MIRWFLASLLTLLPLVSAVAADCRDCPQMVTVTGGLGQLGDDTTPFTVRVASFAIARTETTVRQWKTCAAEGGCKALPADLRWKDDDMPMTHVSFADAQSYAVWLTRKTGQPYRLPTEAEWEFAARAGTNTLFPWGAGMEEGRAVCQHCDPRFDHRPAPAATMQPNPWGLYDMNGNVWEWTLDCWKPSHQGRPRDGIAVSEPGCQKHVVKGGSWYFVPYQSRSASRVGEDGRSLGYDIGFRVVRE
ncbi:SUMF1/EgtB/PvdO family nonheme iron enzyme [Magnetospirillum sp. 64-120]|uniref:formylglycine-generating enzyme family protein n=1 Tax=Magnetospirillum sp. 64-120 TaxID=1895778 RepID=UPI0025C32A72|nr:SUMF1/EgtB/PvdO family nonheme iron enzyme [Magnetospirillum sp. 64-120]